MVDRLRIGTKWRAVLLADCYDHRFFDEMKIVSMMHCDGRARITIRLPVESGEAVGAARSRSTN
jgi:hypothetical protein